MDAVPRLAWKDVVMAALAVVGPVFVVGGALRYDGDRDRQMQENTRRIEMLEADGRRRNDMLELINVRTARIETKLEMLTPMRGAER